MATDKGFFNYWVVANSGKGFITFISFSWYRLRINVCVEFGVSSVGNNFDKFNGLPSNFIIFFSQTDSGLALKQE